jgi:hypothetical protein
VCERVFVFVVSATKESEAMSANGER